MKCDELKRFDIVGKYHDEETMAEFRPDGECYDADEVDAAIAELKAKLESVQATAYTESVDAGMRERKQKRSLWLARAKRAEETQFLWQVYCHCDKLYFCGPSGLATRKNPYRYISRKNAVEWDEFWGKIKNKCLKKAEEYK